MDGKEHGWGFLRDGEEKQVVGVEVDATEGVEKALAKVKLGLKDLLGERAKSSRGILTVTISSVARIQLINIPLMRSRLRLSRRFCAATSQSLNPVAPPLKVSTEMNIRPCLKSRIESFRRASRSITRLDYHRTRR